MFAAFAKSIGQLSDPAVRRVVWTSVGWTAVLFALLYAAVWAGLRKTVLFNNVWLEDTVDALGGIATIGLTWILFPAIASSIVGLLLERVARAVEARHYPGLPPARGAGLAAGIWSSLKLIALMVVLNILALPLYLFPVINLLAFYGLNGYLLGREYFELAALRRLGSAEATDLRRDHGLRVFAAGAGIAFLLTLPVINLLAPVIGTAAMVHLVERWRPQAKT